MPRNTERTFEAQANHQNRMPMKSSNFATHAQSAAEGLQVETLKYLKDVGLAVLV